MGAVPLAFGPDGNRLAVGNPDGVVELWDTTTGSRRGSWTAHNDSTYDFVWSLAISPDGATLATGGEADVKLWNLAEAEEAKMAPAPLASFEAADNVISYLAFTQAGEALVTGSFDGTIKFWRRMAGVKLGSEPPSCTLVSFTNGEWAVLDAAGRYDASNAGDVTGLHWVLRNEPILLKQFKDGYYEPGLLTKLMGFSKEALRRVPDLQALQIYPEVAVTPPAPGSTKLTIHLRNRGGGLGPVEVFLNGKRVIADARPARFNVEQREATLVVFLPTASAAPSQQNRVDVFARALSGLQSRGVQIAGWVAPGKSNARPMRLFAIVAGVSKYADPSLNLRYAGKDAVDFAQALWIGARAWLGEKAVDLALLSDASAPPGLPAPRAATRREFAAAFQHVAKEAQPNDVLVIYLAGHGVALQRGQAQSSYAFLTSDARTTELVNQPAAAQWTVTGEDLVSWLGKTKSQKNALILDTCAAGAIRRQLASVMRASASQIRAIEQMQDRTGFHILMGCAADRVSYETSQFGQGLLTYALLEGMTGPALSEGQFLDVSRLFQHARKRVPELAAQIRLGLQEPQVSAPRGDPFYLGQLGRAERERIHLHQPGPLVLLPTFLSSEDFADGLGLTQAVRQALRERGAASRGAGRPAPGTSLVEGEDLPGAVWPTGGYTVKGEMVTVKLVLKRNQETVGSREVPWLVRDPAKDVPALADQLAQVIEELAAGK